jgi:hypothetical protein
MITELAQIQKICILSELPTGGAAGNFSRIDKVRPTSRFRKRIGVIRSSKFMPLISFDFTASFLLPAMSCLDMEVLRKSSTLNFAYNADWDYLIRFEHETWPGKKELKKALLAIEGSDRQGDLFVKTPNSQWAQFSANCWRALSRNSLVFSVFSSQLQFFSTCREAASPIV